MSVLAQCVPIINIVQDERDKSLTTLDALRGYMAITSQICDGKLMRNKELLDAVNSEEAKCVYDLWKKYDYVPEEYVKSCVPRYNDYSYSPKYNNYWAGLLSRYPTTNVASIVALADKLDMVILPLECVNLQNIFTSFNMSSRSMYSKNPHQEAINNAISYLEGIRKNYKRKYAMYILCPLTYYDLWTEITTGVTRQKYSPPKFESVFQTLELIIPAQQNLYQMAKVNDENIKTVADKLKKNIERIDRNIQQLKHRVINVEAECRALRDKYDALEQKTDEMRIELKQLHDMVVEYCVLDPLVFFVNDDPIDFFDDEQGKRTAHMVSCFGPEFPVEFLTNHDVTIYSTKDQVVKVLHQNESSSRW